jgi:iron complex outermembrane receptor protein
VIELGCSDPANPGGLPNDFASDPDLKQVVARTFEVGARGHLADQSLTWSVDAFHTLNSDDIQFIATSTSAGFFDNVGSTRRQGFDLALGGNAAPLSWHAVYSFVDATYQSSFEVGSESNSSADAEGNIQVQPGNRIPLIPRHTVRLAVDYAVSDKWDVGANLVLSSGVFLHGDENNANQAGGTNGEGAFVVGTGQIGSYTVLNMQSTYHVAKFLDVFVRAVNLLDHKYATAGFLTSNSFDPNGAFRPDPDDWTNENAVSPVQPRVFWAGVRLHWN